VLLSVVSLVLFLVLSGFLTNKVCNSVYLFDEARYSDDHADSSRVDMASGTLQQSPLSFYLPYVSKDNLYKYEHDIYVSCRYEGILHGEKNDASNPTANSLSFDRVFLFDGSVASTHCSAQMMAKVLLKRYEEEERVPGERDAPQRALFCSYDRIGRGKSRTKRSLLDSKNRFTVRHVDKDLYVKQNVVKYALEVARGLRRRFHGKLILIGHGFGANVQSASVAMAMKSTKDRAMFQGLILLDPIQGDEMRHYIRKQTNWGLFYTITGLMRLMTQVMRIPLPMRVAGVTSIGASKYLSDSMITRRNILLCQQKLWEAARDEVDMFPALHSLILYREKRYIGQIPVYVLTSEMIDPSDEDLNAAYSSVMSSSQYVKLSKNTTQKIVPHVSTSEILDRVDYIAEAIETVDPSLKSGRSG